MTMTPERWQRVKSLFDSALSQPPEQRDLWVAGASPDDPDLRREVQSLLAALSDAPDRFERPAVVSLDDLVGEADPERPNLGSRVGPYRLIREVGRGGMGVVFEAQRDDDQYRKRVAIKTISLGRDSELILRRFRYERQILAQLEHRNIAALVDGGITASGQPFFAMEFVEGLPIDDYCDAHRLGVRERLQLFRQVCGAVQHAHQNLVIHRDLKPSNILVTADGTAKLLDFGIAKLLNEGEGEGESGEGLTQAGGGTPLTAAYASPEQVNGEPVSTATDVFSLGVVLYQLISGRHPFNHDQPGAEEVRRRIREQQPTPPSAAAGNGMNRLPRTLRSDLDSITLMALRKEPERRYSSVEQLSDDLQRFRTGLPVLAQPDSIGYRARKFVRRNRGAVAGGAAAALALAFGLAATFWQAAVARGERDRARLEAEKALQVTDFVQGMLRAADPRSQGKDVTVAEALATAEQRADSELKGQPEVFAAVLATIGRTYLGLGRYDDAERPLTRALALSRAHDEGSGKAVVDNLRSLAGLESERGRLKEAAALLEEALARARREPVDSTTLGAVLDAYGSMQLDQGEFGNAEGTLREAVAIRRSLLGNRHQDVAASLNNLAVAVGQQNRFREAIPLHQEALAVLRAAKGPEHPDVATGLNTLANAYAIVGDYGAADSLFRRALDQRVKLLGPHHPEVAWTHYSYADMLRLSGAYARAIPEAEAVLAERGGALPDTHPMISAALHVYGRSLLALGRSREAETALRESLRLRTAAYPPGHWLVASASGALGECLLAQKQYRAAEPLLLQAYGNLKRAKGDRDQRTREIASALVRLYQAMGKPGEAARFRS